MLTKCVNPACPKPLRYLRDGRIFHVERAGPLPDGGKQSHNVEHFWLCGPCSTHLTLTYRKDEGVLLIPLERDVRRAAAS